MAPAQPVYRAAAPAPSYHTPQQPPRVALAKPTPTPACSGRSATIGPILGQIITNTDTCYLKLTNTSSAPVQYQNVLIQSCVNVLRPSCPGYLHSGTTFFTLAPGRSAVFLVASESEKRTTDFTWQFQYVQSSATVHPSGNAPPVAQPQTQTYAAPEPATDPIVGAWRWFHGDTVTFYATGGVRSSIGVSGLWQRNGDNYTITWNWGGQGAANYIDTIRIMPGGTSVQGQNNTGAAVSGTRL